MPAKPEKRNKPPVSRVVSRAARIAFALAAASVVCVGCGYLVWYIHTQLALPAKTRVCVTLACAAAILAVILLARAYIAMVVSEKGEADKPPEGQAEARDFFDTPPD